MSSLFPRPSPSYKLAILFPETEATPLLTWVLCYRKTASENEEYETTFDYEAIAVGPLLGADDPLPGTVSIECNPIRDKILGCGMASWSPRKEGYSI